MKQTYSQLTQTEFQNNIKIMKYQEEFKKFGNLKDCSSAKGYDFIPAGTGLLGHY